MTTEKTKSNLISLLMKTFSLDDFDRATLMAVCESIYILGVCEGVLKSDKTITKMDINLEIEYGSAKGGKS